MSRQVNANTLLSIVFDQQTKNTTQLGTVSSVLNILRKIDNVLYITPSRHVFTVFSSTPNLRDECTAMFPSTSFKEYHFQASVNLTITTDINSLINMFRHFQHIPVVQFRMVADEKSVFLEIQPGPSVLSHGNMFRDAIRCPILLTPKTPNILTFPEPSVKIPVAGMLFGRWLKNCSFRVDDVLFFDVGDNHVKICVTSQSTTDCIVGKELQLFTVDTELEDSKGLLAGLVACPVYTKAKLTLDIIKSCLTFADVHIAIPQPISDDGKVSKTFVLAASKNNQFCIAMYTTPFTYTSVGKSTEAESKSGRPAASA